VHGRLLRFLLTAAVVSALAWAARRALIRWIDGPAEEHPTAPWEPIAAPAATLEAPAATSFEAPADPAERAVKAAAPKKAAAPAKAAKKQPPLGATWAAPGESGACPEGHLVKVKLSSRLYHLPGMSAYARTTPDRCYPTAEAAEADGFTRAKR
jgi:hypothetical protein